MRYLGSKIKLLPAIEAVIQKYNIQGETFADLFAGTGCVGDHFKGTYRVIANDFLYYSYVFNRAKLSFGNIPTFEKFKEIYGCSPFDWFLLDVELLSLLFYHDFCYNTSINS